MTIPSTAKRKVIRSRRWASAGERTVYLDPIAREHTRRFDVYDESGQCLGFIDEYVGSISTPISGTRLVRRGKRRTFWAVNGRDYWRYLPSQSEAIRQLLDSTQGR